MQGSNPFFEKLAISFVSYFKVDSSLRRIQRFMSDYLLDTDLITRFVFALLIHKLCFRRIELDRINWKFGSKDINVLNLAVIYQGDALPLLYQMMLKFGNSSTHERVDLIKRSIRLFGYESIKYLLTESEYVGHHWISFLNKLGIRYHIRIRENVWVKIPRNGHLVKAFWLFNILKVKHRYFDKKIPGRICFEIYQLA
jgi:hypothetical protein